MSADQNGVERAVILIVAMMAAIVYRALDTLISLFHFLITSCFRTTLLLSDDMPLIFAGQKNFLLANFLTNIDHTFNIL